MSLQSLQNASQYGGQLIEDDACCAPDARPANVDAGGMENKRAAFDGQPADGHIVEQHIERKLNHALNFSVVRLSVGIVFEASDYPWSYEKIACKHIAIGKLADHQVRIIKSKFLVKFTLCRFEGRFSCIHCTSWQ